MRNGKKIFNDGGELEDIAVHTNKDSYPEDEDMTEGISEELGSEFVRVRGLRRRKVRKVISRFKSANI